MTKKNKQNLTRRYFTALRDGRTDEAARFFERMAEDTQEKVLKKAQSEAS